MKAPNDAKISQWILRHSTKHWRMGFPPQPQKSDHPYILTSSGATSNDGLIADMSIVIV